MTVFGGDQGLVKITLDGVAVLFGDREPNERAEMEGRRERTRHHLDICHLHRDVTARIPQMLLGNGRTRSVSVPKAKPGDRMTRACEE